ncbi:glycosyltransferase [Henriciella mobilis]|uniref:glycosyltransferase n=1 Tax=Henriciella mobilis TaxID=2305467 RepID=UPI0013142867|nr:glycosyltransferase [Henriciella mobilis]
MLADRLRAVGRATRFRVLPDRELIDLAASLLDEAWYNALYPDVEKSGMAAREHFANTGYAENRSPHPMFDPAYYFEIYPDVRDSGMPAILHYLRSGGLEWRRPCAWVDLDRYYESHALTVSDQLHQTVLEDFVNSDDRLNAFQFFDAGYYVSQAKDAKSLKPNDQLLHFFREGIMQDCDPHPLIKMKNVRVPGDSLAGTIGMFGLLFKEDTLLTHESIDGISDPEFYIRKHGRPKVHPVIDYIRKYDKQDLWPHPLFDAGYYIRANKLEKGVEPLTHYLSKGKAKGARPNRFFDPLTYRRRYAKDIREGQDEIQHYMAMGHMVWFEPSDEFGQRYYLSRYPDVSERREVPLVDFLHGGMTRGRSPLPPKPFFDKTANLSREQIVEMIVRSAGKKVAKPKVSVIVPAYKSVEYTLRCVLTMLESSDETSFEIIVADDQSPDKSGDFLAGNLDNVGPIRVHINEENLGFLKSCNNAAKLAKGEYLFFLNNDTAVVNGWLDELIATFERCPEAGLVGSKLVYPNGLLQEAGGIIWDDGSGANYGRLEDPMKPDYNFQRDADYISGAAIAIPKDLWKKLGGFSEELAPAYYEDTDFAMKVRDAGRRVIYQPLSTVIHFEGISSGTDITSGVKKYQAINQKAFAKKWQETLKEFGKKGDFSKACTNRRSKVRILIFDAEVPKPDKDSGSVTAYQYISILCELGYSVTFVPANLKWEGRYCRELQKLGAEVIYAPYVTDAHGFMLDNGGDFDLVIMSRVTTGGQFFTAFKERYQEIPVIFDTVDIHHLRLQRESELNGSEETARLAEDLKQLELQCIQRADATIVVSDYEVEYLRNEVGPFPDVVIPLIYEPFERTTGFADRMDVAFVGGYRHPPNIDAVHYLVEDIWPKVRALEIGATLHIIGSHMPADFNELSAPDISIVGFVDDLESYLSNIRLTVAPLRYGAGVKGKVGNSLRMGVPVVASGVAAEGMGLRNKQHAAIENGAAAIARAIARVYQDEEEWEALSRAGQAYVQELFGREAAKRKLQELVRGLVTVSH